MSRALPLDAMDSRAVLLGYAAAVLPLGVFVAFWGNAWINGPLNGLPYGIDSLTRMTGTVMSGAGLVALAMSRVGEPVDRRTCLLWFTFAHAAVLAMAFLQSVAIWESATWRELYWLLIAAGMAFIWLLSGLLREGGDPAPLGLYAGLFGKRPQSSTAILKSQYALQMRQAGAQEERNRVARDLHDSVKQQIFAIQTAAATAETRLAADPDGARTALAAVRTAARDSMAEMDAMLDQLRATPLENAGLVDALKRQCEAVRLRTGVDVTFEIRSLPPNEALPPGVHLALFRAAQEALSNAARHARPTHVRVVLGRSGGRLELTVTDDGRGFAVDEARTGMGLRNIRERAAEFGGEAHIGSTPGNGTSVFVSIPFEDANPRYYRNRAGVMLVVFLFFFFTTISRWPQGRGRFSLIILIPVLLDGVRYLVAWRRATRIQNAAQ